MQAWKFAFLRTSQLTSHHVFKVTMAAANICDHSLWNLGATKKVQQWWIRKKVSILISCFLLRGWARIDFNMQWRSFELFFYHFKSCWKCTRCTRTYFKHNNKLIFFWLMESFGRIFRAPKPVHRIPKRSGYSPVLTQAKLRRRSWQFIVVLKHFLGLWSSSQRKGLIHIQG